MQRKRYPKEFKEQLIRETKETGNAAQVARRHEIDPKLLCRWIKESKLKAWTETDKDAKKITTYVPSPHEFRQLESQNTKLKQLLGEKELEIVILRDLLVKIRGSA